MLVLGTYRDVELDAERPFTKTLETLTRKRLAQTIKLAALPEEDVESLLAELGGPSPPQTLVEGIHRETEGNPFFVEEVFQHLKDEAALFDPEGQWRTDLSVKAMDVPEGVRSVIGRRVGRVSEESQRVLTLGAVVGRGFSFELLEAVADVTGDALLRALEEAEGNALIVPTSTREATWEFSHGLIRQTLTDGLSVPRRQRLHLRVAEALERTAGDAVTRHASDLAHHFYQAGARADPATTLRYVMMAGERGMETGAFQEAVRHFERAQPFVPTADRPALATVLTKLGLAQRSVGQWEAGLADGMEALAIYEDLGDRENVVASCWDWSFSLAWIGRPGEAANLGRRGLDVAGSEASAERSRMLTVVGGSLMHVAEGPADLNAADDMVAQGVAMAETLGDPRVRKDVSLLSGWHHFWRMRCSQQAEDALAAAGLARTAGDLWLLAESVALFQRGSVLLGRLDGVSRFEEEAEVLARRIGHLGAETIALIARGHRDWLVTADFDRFEASVLQVLDVCKKANMVWESIYGAWLPLANVSRGRWHEARDHAEELVGREPPGGWVGHNWSALFLCECLLDHRETALDLLDERRSHLPVADQPNTIGAWTMLLGTIEGLALLGEWEPAAELYPLALDAIDTGTLVSADARRLLQTVAGIAAASGRRWEEAETHYETALRQAHEIPFRSEQPEVRRWYARMLIDRNAPGDHDKARTMLREAVEMYQAIGMPKHVEMVEELQAAVPVV